MGRPIAGVDEEKHDLFWSLMAVTVCLLLFFQILLVNYLIKADKSELASDAAEYYQYSIVMVKYLSALPYPSDSFFHVFYQYYALSKPPFFMISSLPFYWIFGPTPDTARLTNIPYYVLLIAGLYLIGKKVHSRKSGILSALLAMLTPAIFFQVGGYMTDLALMTLVVLTILAYELTESFRKIRYIYLLGIVLSIGMLIRWNFLLFILPWVAFDIFINWKKIAFYNQKHIIFSGIISAILVLPWYIINLRGIIEKLTIQTPECYYPSFFSYISFNKAMLGGIILFLMLALLLAFLFQHSKYKYHLLLTILIPFLIMSLHINKDERYLLPLIPFLILVSSIAILNLKNESLKKVLILVSVALFAIFFLRTYYHPEGYKTINPEYLLIQPRSDFEYDKLIGLLKEENKTGIVLFVNEPRSMDRTLVYLINSNFKSLSAITLSYDLNDTTNYSLSRYLNAEKKFQEISLIVLFTRYRNPLYKMIYERLDYSFVMDKTVKSDYLDEEYIIYKRGQHLPGMKKNETSN